MRVQLPPSPHFLYNKKQRIPVAFLMTIIDLFFPKSCLGCGRVGKYVCRQCIDKTPSASGVCIYCKRLAVDGASHVKCLTKGGPTRFCAVWMYEGVVKKAIIALKYKFASEVAKDLQPLIVEQLDRWSSFFPAGTIIVPIPLAKKRRRWRGFNQVEGICSNIADTFGWKYIKLLERSIYIRPQAGLDLSSRKKNIKGVFKFKNTSDYILKNTQVIIFDDVVTTGATVCEAAKVLSRAGLSTISVISLAR